MAALLGGQVGLVQVRAQQREHPPVPLGKVWPGSAAQVQPYVPLGPGGGFRGRFGVRPGPGSPAYAAMPAYLVREALLNGEDLAPAAGPGHVPSSAAATVTRTVVAGGMPGWQIALIAAALLAATIAVLVDRARAARRTVITVPASCDQEASASFVPAGSAPEHDVAHFP